MGLTGYASGTYIVQRMSAVRQAWPGVHVPDAAFRAYVRERLGDGDGEATESALDALFIACACSRGDAAAVKAFDATYMPDVARAIVKLRLSPADAADVVQSLREQLLVRKAGGAGGAPGISEYAGRGELGAWLRVSAVRAGLKKLRGRKPQVDADDALLAARSLGDDPELGYMKEVYRRAFREAFATALGALDAREKNLLHQHFVDGLNVDELGRLYGTHRATAARWVQKAREHLLDETKKDFARRAGISARECASVLRLVRSRIDVTLSKLLG
jgi:RNA polymerase sigma-70 factor (ECF subfamily)